MPISKKKNYRKMNHNLFTVLPDSLATINFLVCVLSLYLFMLSFSICIFATNDLRSCFINIFCLTI